MKLPDIWGPRDTLSAPPDYQSSEDPLRLGGRPGHSKLYQRRREIEEELRRELKLPEDLPAPPAPSRRSPVIFGNPPPVPKPRVSRAHLPPIPRLESREPQQRARWGAIDHPEEAQHRRSPGSKASEADGAADAPWWQREQELLSRRAAQAGAQGSPAHSPTPPPGAAPERPRGHRSSSLTPARHQADQDQESEERRRSLSPARHSPAPPQQPPGPRPGSRPQSWRRNSSEAREVPQVEKPWEAKARELEEIAKEHRRRREAREAERRTAEAEEQRRAAEEAAAAAEHQRRKAEEAAIRRESIARQAAEAAEEKERVERKRKAEEKRRQEEQEQWERNFRSQFANEARQMEEARREQREPSPSRAEREEQERLQREAQQRRQRERQERQAEKDRQEAERQRQARERAERERRAAEYENEVRERARRFRDTKPEPPPPPPAPSPPPKRPSPGPSSGARAHPDFASPKDTGGRRARGRTGNLNSSLSRSRSMPATSREQEIAMRHAKAAAMQQLMALRNVPNKHDREKGFKALLREWHPDKNPQSVDVATAVFQLLQAERGKVI